MHSDDKLFLLTPGIQIFDDRNLKDFAFVRDNEFSGIE